MYKKVLLAADGSEHSIRAAHHAAALVKGQEDGHVDIVNVIDVEQSKSDVLKYGDTALMDLKRKEALAPIEEIFKEASLSYEIHFKHGDPGPTIVRFANERKYDCVVLGSRGLNPFQTMVLGSVSHKVMKRVNGPVMVVK